MGIADVAVTDNDAETDAFVQLEAEANRGPPEGEIRYPGALAARSFSLGIPEKLKFMKNTEIINANY